MSTSIRSIRRALAANLESIPGCQVSAYVLANPTLPTLWVRPATDEAIEYHRAMGNGVENVHMTVQAYFGTSGDIAAQERLDDLLASTGTKSVKAAIESDRTLGGAADDLVVQSCSGYQEYARPDGTTAFGAQWNVLVLTTGI